MNDRLLAALEAFVLITREYPMSGKQWAALQRVEQARATPSNSGDNS